MKTKVSRSVSFILILVMYLAAAALGLLTYRWTARMGDLPATLLADGAATLAIWLLGVILDNSSIYDPYWSVAPVMIIIGWAISRGRLMDAADVLALAAIMIWGVRLTVNWAARWKGLNHEDWRYGMYRRKMPRLWFVVNLFGINLMPTLLVFLGMVPAYFIMASSNTVCLLTLAGFAVCLAAAGLELLSDRQMETFKKRAVSGEACIEWGLWSVSRHPNYLGEILFWWGIWLMQISVLPGMWYTAAGPLFITLLFVFVSIPMMEEHVLSARPAYADYKKRVPMLVPFVGLKQSWKQNKLAS
jgi:steroid 5-alpha reductase family enzyme